jgi:hypothetical protein
MRREFAPGFVNYKRVTRMAAASDKVYQLLAHGRWFSPGTPASSTIKTDCHDIAEILLKVALNTKDQKSNQPIRCGLLLCSVIVCKIYEPINHKFIRTRLYRNKTLIIV